MALKALRPKSSAVPHTLKDKKQKGVSVSSELRRKYTWFDELAQEKMADALKARRVEKKKDGPPLSPGRLESVLGQLERLQRQLNPLEKRKERLVKRLIAHWGHTGERELLDDLGNTLISTSATLTVDLELIRKGLGEEEWLKLLVSVMKLEYLLVRADTDERYRGHIKNAIVVDQLKVAVIPPSSRRPKSGTAAA